MWQVDALETISIDGTAIGFTASVHTPTNARPMTSVRVKVVSGGIYATFDGTTPTAGDTGGEFFGPGSSFMVSTLPDINNFLAINAHSAALLFCHYMRNE